MRLPSQKRTIRAGILGIWTLSIGFLTTAAYADLISDALACLENQRVLESQRNRLLAQADSLGRRMEAGSSPSPALLRQAERLQRQAFDQEMDLLSRREQCRRIIPPALQECERRILEVQDSLRAGARDPAAGGELLHLQEIRAGLQGSLNVAATLHYILLPPDSLDTQETLRSKLQYHQDVRAYMEGLDRRVASRLRQVREEGRALAEAGRFLVDLAFLDEGGRGPAGGVVPTPGVVGGGQDRPVLDLPRGLEAGDLEFALRLAPTSLEESEKLARMLDGFRREIQRELGALSNEIKEIQGRMLPVDPGPR